MKRFLLCVFVTQMFVVSTVSAQTTEQETEKSVVIVSPEKDDILKSSKPVILDYEILPGPKRDHAHVMVDGKMAALVRALRGSFDLGKLKPGKHTIKIIVMNVSHYPVGKDASVTFKVEK